MAANGVSRVSLAMNFPFQVWGVSCAPSGGNFEFQVSSEIQGHFRNFQNSEHNESAGGGNGGFVLFIKRPYMLDRGETVTAILRNLTTAAIANPQVCLLGTIPDCQQCDYSRMQSLAKASLPGRLSASSPIYGSSGDLVVTSDPFVPYPLNGAAATTVLQYTVPTGFRAYIKSLAIVAEGGSFIDGSGNVIWRVKRNQGWVEGLNNLTSQIGQWSLPQILNVPIEGTEGDVIQVTVEVPAGQPNMPVGATTGARFVGWVTPVTRA